MNPRILVILPLLAFLLVPVFVSADSRPINSNVWSPAILKGPLVTCTGTGDPGTNQYACTSLCDLVSTTAEVLYFFIGVVIWIFAPLIAGWAGILIMTAQGSAEGLSKAKRIATGVFIGLLIALSSYLILKTFISIVGITGIGGFGANSCPL